MILHLNVIFITKESISMVLKTSKHYELIIISKSQTNSKDSSIPLSNPTY